MTNKQRFPSRPANGYYAPKSIRDRRRPPKQEIREAIFRRKNCTDVPIELQTPIFKTESVSARLSVLTVSI